MAPLTGRPARASLAHGAPSTSGRPAVGDSSSKGSRGGLDDQAGRGARPRAFRVWVARYDGLVPPSPALGPGPASPLSSGPAAGFPSPPRRLAWPSSVPSVHRPPSSAASAKGKGGDKGGRGGDKGGGGGKGAAAPRAPGSKLQVTAFVKLSLTAGKATPAPPVGPALGSKGVNLVKFCAEYNALTQGKSGTVPVEVTVFEDRSFNLVLKTPPTSTLLKLAAGIAKGPADKAVGSVGRITEEQIKAVALEKMPDLNCKSVESAISQVEGTAKSLGLTIVSAEADKPPRGDGERPRRRRKVASVGPSGGGDAGAGGAERGVRKGAIAA